MKNGAYKACELLTVFGGNQTRVVTVADPSRPRLAGHREVRIWAPERGLDTAQIELATALATRDHEKIKVGIWWKGDKREG